MPLLSVSQLPLLVVVLGPTGSGKTELAIALARNFQGEILSCDSVAVYRGMELGTAKPSAAQRAAVPHHLLDMVAPDTAMSAGEWARAARAAAREVTQRGHLPIVCGGTGLYLRAFTEGLAPLPPRCPVLRNRLVTTPQGRPAGYLHRLLTRLNPSAAAAIHPNDSPKLIRAIEIALLSGPEAAIKRDPLQGFRVLRLGLDPPRAALYDRLNRRAAAMFAAGLVEETRRLRQQFGAQAPALGSLGYREASAVLDGTLSEEAAIPLVQQGHRNYAKRQMTWFRREPDVLWLTAFGDEASTQAEGIGRVAHHLDSDSLERLDSASSNTDATEQPA